MQVTKTQTVERHGSAIQVASPISRPDVFLENLKKWLTPGRGRLIPAQRYKMTSSRRRHLVDTYDDCPCSGATLSRLLQPAIMTIIAGKGLHGYAIVERLAEAPTLAGDRPDPTGVYRALSMMEERGFVTSSWDTSERGPAKRVYELTSQGHKCLARWISSLSDYHRAIGELLENVKKASARLKRSGREEGK